MERWSRRIGRIIASTLGLAGTRGQGGVGERSEEPGERSEGAAPWGPAGAAAALVGAVLAACAYDLVQGLAAGALSSPGALKARFLRDLVAAACWVPVGCAVVWLARRRPLRRGAPPPRLVLHLAGAGAAALALNLLIGTSWLAVGLWPGDTAFGDLVLRGTLGHLHTNALLYALVAGATSAAVVERSAAGVGRAGAGANGAGAGVPRGGGPGPEPWDARLAASAGPTAPPVPDRIAVPDRGRTLLVPVETIDWVEAEGDYVTLHADGRAHLVTERMNAMEARLAPAGFARCHRSAIVNLARVRAVRPEPGGNATLVLDDGTPVPLSRRRRAEVEARLGA